MKIKKTRIIIILVVLLLTIVVIAFRYDNIKYKWRVAQLFRFNQTEYIEKHDLLHDLLDVSCNINASYNEDTDKIAAHISFSMKLRDKEQEIKYLLLAFKLNPKLDDYVHMDFSKFKNHSSPLNLGRSFSGGTFGANYGFPNGYTAANRDEAETIVELLQTTVYLNISYDGGRASFAIEPTVTLDETMDSILKEN